MELGLSLGGESKNTKSSNGNKNGGLWFCMELGNGHGVLAKGCDEKLEKSTENEENHASDGKHTMVGGDDGDEADEDDDDEEDGDGDDQRAITSVETPVQLNLLPLAPVPRQTPWSSDDGSSDNNSSGNMVGLPATRGFDVNMLPGSGEKVLSANSMASSPFPMDFSIYGGTSGNIGKKRDLEVVSIFGRNDVVEADRACSRASDEDENGPNARKKLRLSKEQSAFLEESFKEHSTLNPKQKLALAKQLNLRPRQVEVWFQNRRARTKLKQTEVDCEYLKRCCETLTEENRRLHKELQELRALKTSNPFYMQLPATTLTMCPSCERVATTTTAPPSTTVPTTSTTAPNAKTNIIIKDSSSPKPATPFPLSRPKFFPFSPTPSHSHQSAAS